MTFNSSRRAVILGFAAVPFATNAREIPAMTDTTPQDADYYGRRVNEMGAQSSAGVSADVLISQLKADQHNLGAILQYPMKEAQRTLAISTYGFQSILLASQYCKKTNLPDARAYSEHAYKMGQQIGSRALMVQAINVRAITEFHYGSPEVGLTNAMYGLKLVKNTKDYIHQAMMYSEIMANAAKLGQRETMDYAQRNIRDLQQKMDKPRFLTAFTLSPDQLYNSMGYAHEAIGSRDAHLYFLQAENALKPKDPRDKSGNGFRYLVHFSMIRSLAATDPSMAVSETKYTLQQIKQETRGHIDQIYADRAVMVLNRLPEDRRDDRTIDDVLALIRGGKHAGPPQSA